ncbi:MAG: trypsin-like peptidase domain-containing protein [Chloroflexi bacterium]|nr:trypsin-like peptidase domain-containing protein [Chloroflexota bacterium]
MSASQSPAGRLLQSLSDDLANAVASAGRGIVRVEARRSNPASGVIWSSDGLILTAHHVLERDDAIKVVLDDGREVSATIAGRDPGSDLAVLRASASGLPAVTPAPADSVRLGHLVLAVGRPFALSATLGVVSSVGGPWRTWHGGRLDRLVQTDAPFHPGYSGGALIDAAGRLVGLISSQLGRGLNLAIPADLAAGIAEALLSQGRIRRAFLGIGSQPVDLPGSLRQRLSLEQSTGLLIITIETGGPAERAGLLVGDILIGLSGQPVAAIDDLQAHLAALAPGVAAPIRLVRGGALTDVTVTLGERGAPPA